MTNLPRSAIVGFALGLLLLTCNPDYRAQGPSPETPARSGKDEPGWRKLFDGKSLDHWKAADFFGAGKVRVEDGAIIMEKGKLMTGIVYTRGDFPKMDYEVTLEGKKIAGDDFFATTTFPVGDSFCSFVVGGWGGTVVGLSSINSMDASQNETTKTMEFQKDQWYRLRLRVSKKRIEAWIDRDKMVDLDPSERKIATRIECRGCQPFGIATYETTGAVRDIRVRLLTEREDYAKVDPRKLGIEFVPARKDPKTGFIVGGKNATSLVAKLPEIAGLSIQELEENMRPGNLSTAGFLAKEERLLDVLAADNRYVVEELGLTHQQLARHLLVLGAVAVKEAGKEPKEIAYHGRRYKVQATRFRAFVKSPFEDGTKTNDEVTVENLGNGKKLTYSLLVPVMIERYGFYEGKGTRFRVEPRALVDILDFLDNKKQH